MRKNINPISLKGQDKLNRSLDLMKKMTTLNESTSTSELELVKRAANGIVYGIVRENHKYFIKETDKRSGEITANDFNYIGGLQNKLSESYKSYSEALKHLNLRFDAINESMGIEGNVNIFESDGVAFAGGTGFGFVLEEEDEDEEEIDEQEYKLKVDAPTSAEPASEPVEDEVDVPADDMGDDLDMDMDSEPMDDMGDESDDEDNPTKKIQKLTGKIGQMMREMDEPDAELEKYVINSIISAMHLDLLSEEDIEDIINKIEGEEEEDSENADTNVDLDLDTDLDLDAGEGGEEELPAPEAEVTEESRKFKKSDLLESLTKDILKERLTESESFTDYSPSGRKAGKSYKGRRKSLRDKTRGTLKGSQYKLDKAPPFGKLTAADFKKLRGEGMNDFMDEHHGMSYDKYGKYDHDEYMMMDEDFDVWVDDSNDYMDCPRCKGMGCPHCDDKGYHLSNEFDSFDMDGMLDEDDGYGVNVADSISGTFSDEDFMMYDPQSGGMGPFDFDGDGIPSRLDLDADGDGDIDGSGDDLDFEFFADPTTKPRPKTRPDIGTKPDEKKRRGPWEKPKTKPNPKAGLKEESPKERRSFRKKGWYK